MIKLRSLQLEGKSTVTATDIAETKIWGNTHFLASQLTLSALFVSSTSLYSARLVHTKQDDVLIAPIRSSSTTRYVKETKLNRHGKN